MANNPIDKQSKYCPRCQRILRTTEFYKSNNLNAHPDGYCDQCKQCQCAHLDAWDSSTFLHILEDCDVPYVPEEWNKTLTKVAQTPEKMSPTIVMGKYLSKMKLGQWRKYRYVDTETLMKIKEKNIRELLESEGKTESQIQEALTAAREQSEVKPEKPAALALEPGTTTADSLPGLNIENNLDLTEEDITYLALKWGKTYQPFEWVQLEQLYQDMMASYDIQTAGHIDTLKMLCKSSLKANQLFDLGDIDGALKMTKAYDTLMKSGNFTAVQNKNEMGNNIDSVGELVLLCEKKGYIEQYYSEKPQDKVDWVMLDMQKYTERLVKNEINLNDMIDRAMQQIQEDKTRKEDAEDLTDEEFDKELFRDITEEGETLTDEDFMEFQEFEEGLSTAQKKEMISRAEKDDIKVKNRIVRKQQIEKNKEKREGIEARRQERLEGVDINDGTK